ncbi:LysR family transcriptional regulator [Duganella sp. HH105]|uniref:LysR family transcriptional regulator n=1 Tax=Duganella sp. HH105 TaxID=1781067 RepID=UPI000877D20D|nr:LysR family transcriptional regulator [Duganella sp. HH105]OEZ62783.1 HTH-type transcriptional regulator PgrR [Duganella sp. HH105]
METMISIECFVRSAEAGSFSEAARRLGLTPAAVGKNISRLEARLGVRLFQRSTRSLSLTEAGRQFLDEVGGSLSTIQNAVANLASAGGQPAGTLRVSMPTNFGRKYIVPMLSEFLQRYPAISPDWAFDNRPVDLIAQGYDAAVGGGIDLSPGVVARRLCPAHRILVASPAYLAEHAAPKSPADLHEHDGILIRSPQTGRIRPWALVNRGKEQAPVTLRVRMTMSDPGASCDAAALGLGIALINYSESLAHLETGTLVRVLPGWHVDGGSVSIYYPAQKLLPAKTRAFVEFVVERFRAERLAQVLSAV